MNTISGEITNEKEYIKLKTSNIMSIITIIFLSCIALIFIVLNFNMIKKINKSSSYTVVYEKVAKEEPTVLRVNF